MFLALFLVGLLGFVLMTAMGFVHTGGHSLGQSGGHSAIGAHGAGGHAVGGHALGGHGAGTGHAGLHLPGHGGHSHLPATAKGGPTTNRGSTKGVDVKVDRAAGILMLLSPVNLFSLLMGAGAAGLLLQHALAGFALGAAAVAGALIFCLGIVRPLMNVLGNFAARPSEGLEGMVAKTATAVTRFDQDGRGLISLTLDGQAIQVLALLEADEVRRGIQVAKGDPLIIVEVDKVRNSCLVTRELAV